MDDSAFSTRAIALALALAPAIPIALCLIGVGRWRPAMMGTAFATGTLACLVGMVTIFIDKAINLFGNGWAAALSSAFLVAAIPEELTKFAGVQIVVAQHEDTDIGLDLILGSAWLALGFGIFENIFYVVGSPRWAVVGLLRAVLAVPTHVACGLTMGACLAMAAFSKRRRWAWRAAALAVPILLHGAYDSAILIGNAEKATEMLPPATFLALAAVAVVTAWLLPGPIVRAIRLTGSTDLLSVGRNATVQPLDSSMVGWVRGGAHALFILGGAALAVGALICALVLPVPASQLFSLVALMLALAVMMFGYALFTFRAARAFRRGAQDAARRDTGDTAALAPALKST